MLTIPVNFAAWDSPGMMTCDQAMRADRCLSVQSGLAGLRGRQALQARFQPPAGWTSGQPQREDV